MIADYLYNLEQKSTGSGIAKLKSWGFDINSYHAYNAGSLQSVCVSGHRNTGFNQWDEQWEGGSYGGNGLPAAGNGIRSKSTDAIPAIPNC